jgi:hypothetical protein
MSTTISITRALSELKTLDKRIEKLCTQNVFITTTTTKSDSSSIEEDMKAGWKSINDLISRYQAIKFAIIRSNATTNVRIGTKTYTVSEAIAMKESTVKQQEKLLNALRQQRASSTNAVSYHTQQIQSKLDSLLEINFKERKTSEDDLRTIKEAYLKNNEIRVIDPLKIDAKISCLETELENFVANVDFCLSESNAITTITV